jgi:hypothetical protein
MILDRLKKIETNVVEEDLEEICERFDEEIYQIEIKRKKNIYIHINIIDRIKNIIIVKNLKKNNLNIHAKGYSNDEEKTIKTFKSRIKTK